MNTDNKFASYIELQIEAKKAFKHMQENTENVLELATMGHIFHLGFDYGCAFVEMISGIQINEEILDAEPHTSIATYLPYDILIDSTTVEIFTSGFINGYCFSNEIEVSDLTFD